MSFFILKNINEAIDDINELDIQLKLELSSCSYQLVVYDNPDISSNTFFIEKKGDDFLLVFGTFFYKEFNNQEALKYLFNDFSKIEEIRNKLQGHFILISYVENKIKIINDSLNAYKIYYNESEKVFSNSFPLIVKNLPLLENDINQQAVYEYLINGCVFGNKTIANIIVTTPNDHLIEITKQRIMFKSYPSEIDIGCEIVTKSLNEWLTSGKESLIALFDKYCNAGYREFKVALSGGFDSRLLVALFLNKNVKPSVFVYGEKNDQDVKIAKTICEGLDINLDIINKNKKYNVELTLDLLKKSYWMYGALPYIGLLNVEKDYFDRLKRSQDNTVLVNGSAGEIFRHFYYLSNKNMSKKEFVQAFHQRYVPNWFTNNFNEEVYTHLFINELDLLLGAKSSIMSRDKIDALYYLLRARYWTAHDMVTNQHFGQALYPFLEPSVIKETIGMPFKLRLYGFFEAKLMVAIYKKIASFNSSYGFSFTDKIPLGYKIKMLSTFHRPVWLRKKSLSFKKPSINDLNKASSLRKKYIKLCGEPKFIHKYLNVENITNVDVLNRALTLEYFFSYCILRRKN